jgi:hypothetical protein
MESKLSLEQRIDRRLKSGGFRLDELKAVCEQIILFGSTTMRGEREGSDVDLLCVGYGPRVKTRRIDLVWCCPTKLMTKAWLGSELANHVARYGRWLYGLDNWSNSVFTSQKAIRNKRRSIRSRARALEKWWQKLRPEYRAKHVLKLRRDLQRLALLNHGIPVEPSALLDRRWRGLCRAQGGGLPALMSSEGRLLSRRQIRLIAHLLK